MLISVSGKIFSGKDATGQIINILLNNPQLNNEGVMTFLRKGTISKDNWQIKKFADKLKDIVCLLLGCSREDLEKQEFKETVLGEEWLMPLQEEWKAVVGYENLYEISNFGRVKSLNRLDSMGRVVEETIKAYHINTTGYPAITLNKEGKKKTKMIHQLVVQSFLGHIPNNYNGVVNHLDEIKTNNRLDNLEVVSSRYNTQYSKPTKGVYERKGKFEVYIRINGKKAYLGTYTSKEEALKVRNTKLQEIDTFIPLKYTPKQWTPRLMLQVLGTQVGRQILHPQIWVNSLMSDYKPLVSVHPVLLDLGSSNAQLEKMGPSIPIEYPSWIITDTRFPNELEAVEKRNGVTIRVTRPKPREVFLMNAYETINTFTKEHASESALDSSVFQYELSNDGTMEDLIDKVRDILIKENLL